MTPNKIDNTPSLRSTSDGAPSEGAAARRTGDVAIVGMSCLLPGAANLRQFWENVLAKTCSISEPPPGWDAERYHEPTNTPSDRTYCVRGGFLGDLATFNPLDFGVMPNSLDGGEPDHFLTLRVADEALRDAGYTRDKLDPERTEIILGRGTYINRGVTSLYQHVVVVEQTLDIIRQLRPDLSEEDLGRLKEQLREQLPPFKPETIPSMIPNILSGRIANRLNLMGSNFIVDAACASSLVAVELGMNDLLLGKCDLAVVGGINTTISPATLMLFSQIEALSRQGQLRAFDQGADGTLLGEGLGIIVLKRREDAERDGNRIYAMVKGVGIASDGMSQGLLAPRQEGQMLAMRRAYAAAGVAPETVGLIEAHGTGVPLGDETEMQSLKRVFDDNRGSHGACNVGTVKANIGHLLTASGMAGLIKTALALYHRVLPPTVGCDEPQAKFGLESSSLYVNGALRPWVHGADTPRRAGINAFGFGGINSHAILEEAPREEDPALLHLHRNWDSELFLFHGSSREALIDGARRALQVLAENPRLDLINFACEQNIAAPASAAETLSIVCTNADDLKKKLEYAIGRLADPTCKRIRENEGIYYFAEPLGGPGRVAFVFPGEGSQYADMLADLGVHFPEVRECFDGLDKVFVDAGRTFLPSQAVFPASHNAKVAANRLWAMDTGAESVFVGSLAMAKLMSLCQITPAAVVGHSEGEYGALVTSGALSIDDPQQFSELVLGVNQVFEQCRLDGLLTEGVLLAVSGAGATAIEAVVRQSEGKLHVAMENCPLQWVLFGQEAEIDAADSALREQSAMSVRLPFNRAYHTSLFAHYSESLRRHLNELEIHSPQIDTYSCVTAEPFPAEPDTIRDLMASQWSHKVRFSETVQAMYARGVRIFIEVGPRANLTGFVDNILKKQPHLAVASNVHFRSGVNQFQHMLGLLHAHHVKFDPSILYRHRCGGAAPGEATTPPPAKDEATQGMPINNLLPRLTIRGDSVPRWNPPVGSPPATVRLNGEHRNGENKNGGRTNGNSSHGAAAISPSQDLPAPVLLPAATPRREVKQAIPAADPAVMAEFFATLREHARVEAEVCQMFLGSGVSQNGATQHPEMQSPAGSQETAFLDEILSVAPGVRAVALCHFDLRQDRFLRDHAFGGHVSHADPELVGLPVVPLTFSMELLAECAKLLAPGKRLIGMREVRAHRWIGLDDGAKTLEIIAETIKTSGETIQVRGQLREVDGSANDANAPVIVEAELILADRFPAPPVVDGFDLQSRRASAWSSRELYDGFMFHGPTLQGVNTVDECGDDGVIATLLTLPSEPLREGWGAATFECDPILLDAAGQVIGYWTSDVLPSAYHVFPYRLEALEVFGPPLPAGVVARCQARVVLCGETLIRSDIEILDPAGRLHMRLQGWWDHRFAMPSNFERLIADPLYESLSESCTDALASLPGDLPAACMVTSSLSEEFLSAHDSIWERALAHIALGAAEREQWRGMTASPEARRNWLAGRIAAKDAARAAVEQTTGEMLYPADVEIYNDADGRPHLEYLVAGEGLPDLQLSLAHTNGVGVAIVANAEDVLELGIDAEFPRDLEQGFAESAFSSEERQLFNTLQPANRNATMIEAWCVKEASAKALGSNHYDRPTICLMNRQSDPAATVRISAEACLDLGLSGDLHDVQILEHGALTIAICALAHGQRESLSTESNSYSEEL